MIAKGQKIKQYANCKIGTLAKISGEHSPVICPNVQFFTHNPIIRPPSKWSFVWIMKMGINYKIKCCTLGCLQNYPCNFCMTFVQKDKTAMFDLEIDSKLHYSHKGSFLGGSHSRVMCEKLHIWTNYRGVFPWNFCKCANFAIWILFLLP